VVAFGGRIIGDGEPKYLNSPETPVFHKGSELYNLHRARSPIAQQGHALVVEGYMDVVALAQYGIDNVVATLGTATTTAHLQRLFRLAPSIIFCFDGDQAGRAAAWRALETALPELGGGRQASFLFLPDGEDPDSLVRKEGAQGLRDRSANAKPLPDFLFETALFANIPNLKFPGSPLKLTDSPATIRRVPPMLGQHNEEILEEAGYSPEKIADLKERGVLGS